MTATTVPAEVPISEARALLTTIATAAKEHGARTALIRHGKAVALVVPADEGVMPRPEQWAAALQAYGGLDRHASLPTDVSRFIEAAADLLGAYYGYDGAGTSHEPAEEAPDA